MISKFFTTLFTVSRQEWSEDSDGQQFSALAEVGTFLGHKQQASAELAQQLALNFTKTFTVWCPVDEDIREGDSIETEAGETYLVRAIQTNDTGNNQHLELVVEFDQLVETSS